MTEKSPYKQLLPSQFYQKPVAIIDPVERDERIEAFFKATGANIHHGGNKCFYVPSLDFVQMAPFETFKSPDFYYSVLAHELGGHWSGHSTRLNRDLSGKFGDASHAYEEVVAELTSGILCADLGIEREPEEIHAPVGGKTLAWGSKSIRNHFANHDTRHTDA